MPPKTKRPYRYPEHLNQILRFILRYQEEHHGRPPTSREVAEAFPTNEGNPRSTSVVRFWYHHMADQGMIEYYPRTARGVVPLVEL